MGALSKICFSASGDHFLRSSFENKQVTGRELPEALEGNRLGWLIFVPCGCGLPPAWGTYQELYAFNSLESK